MSKKLKFKFIYEHDESGNALYDYCSGCERPVMQIDLGEGSFGCEYCKYSNSIEIREVKQ